MNGNLIYFPILLVVVFILSLTTIESFNSAIGQLDPSQDPIQPIPPYNNTNNQTTPIVFFTITNIINQINKNYFQ